MPLSLPAGMMLAEMLTGCATAPFEPARLAAAPACPVIAEYGREFREGLASELARLPVGSYTARAVSDYGKLRDQSRVCRRASPHSRAQALASNPVLLPDMRVSFAFPPSTSLARIVLKTDLRRGF